MDNSIISLVYICDSTIDKFGSYAVKALQKRHLWKRVAPIVSVYEDKFLTSNEKYYWAGFIAADGCIKSKSELSIGLAIYDINHLKKLQSTIGGSLYQYKTHCEWVAHKSHKVIEFLNSLNIYPRKSLTLEPPSLEHICHIKDFIRGYFDGDGSFSIVKNRNNTRCIVSFLGTQSMMLWIKQQLQLLNLLSSPSVHKHKSIFALSYSVKIDVKTIMDWLYLDANMYLERKYVRYHQSKSLLEYQSIHNSIYKDKIWQIN